MREKNPNLRLVTERTQTVVAAGDILEGRDGNRYRMNSWEAFGPTPERGGNVYAGKLKSNGQPGSTSSFHPGFFFLVIVERKPS